MPSTMSKSHRVKDYYKILNIKSTADRGTIRRARNDLALQFHPDKSSGDAEATAKFRDVQEAYEVLINPALRENYDSNGASGSDDDDGYREEDVDQEIWNQWHASFAGRKGSSTSRTEWFSARSSSVPESSATTTVGRSEFQQTNNVVDPTTPDRPILPNDLAFHPTSTDYNTVWISSDDDETAKDADQDVEQDDERCDNRDVDGQDVDHQNGDHRDDGDREQPTDKDTSTGATPTAAHWTFSDYFESDYTEKPLLSTMRDTVANTRRKYRTACKNVDTARIELKYAETVEEKQELKAAYERRCEIRSQWANVKNIREANVKKHEAIARDRLRVRKAQDKQRDSDRKRRKKAAEKASRKVQAGIRRSAGQRGRYAGVRLSRHDEESEDEWFPSSSWNA